jgi:hypothetical protein
MLTVQTTASKRWQNCAACGKNIKPQEFCMKVGSDVDPGRKAILCVECFTTSSAAYQAEKIEAMIAKNFPNEARTRKAQSEILDKIQSRKENAKCQTQTTKNSNRTKSGPKPRPADTTGSSSPAPAERRGSSPRRAGTKCASSPTSSEAGRSRKSR